MASIVFKVLAFLFIYIVLQMVYRYTFISICLEAWQIIGRDDRGFLLDSLDWCSTTCPLLTP